MNDYVIGAGAVLTAGPTATIAGATVHAQTDAALAPTVAAALIDFESASLADVTKLVVLGRGWNARLAREQLIEPLLSRRACSLVDVITTLARAAGVAEVHLFARWLPDDRIAAALRSEGVGLVVHPLESIRQAALISGQSFARWPSSLRAA